jgi:phage terminase Nu1 subunit (DNA packaging protein)
MTLTEYAKRRGKSLQAISKAVKVGRLSRSVGRTAEGHPFITDPELADQEMDANTRQSVSDPIAPEVRAAVIGLPAGTPPYQVSQAVRAAAAARREQALADSAELDLEAKRMGLTDAAEVREEVLARYSMVKTKLLAVPSQVAQRMPHLAKEIEPVIDELIREALEELSSGGASAG